MSGRSASRGVANAKQFLGKLHGRQKDFAAMHLSERHALNALTTAYHLHEWVWGECEKRDDLRNVWRVNSIEEFHRYIIEQCPALEDARKIINGTKHFENRIVTGGHAAGFRRGAFQDDAFDVRYLWVDRNGKQQRAEDFIDELVRFWDEFFEQYQIEPTD
jgi:hypothetical protein